MNHTVTNINNVYWVINHGPENQEIKLPPLPWEFVKIGYLLATTVAMVRPFLVVGSRRHVKAIASEVVVVYLWEHNCSYYTQALVTIGTL